MQITRPSATEKSIVARDVRRAFARIAVEQGVVREPAEHQVELPGEVAASRKPAHIPWPAKGGIRCAASPAISTRPRRQRSAQQARKVYTAWRSSVALPGRTPHGGEQLPGGRVLFSSSTSRAAGA